MISEELLRIIVCPETKQTLVLVESETLHRINSLIEKGEVKDRSGQLIEEKIDGGLMREDQKYLYPIRNGVPVLIIDESIIIDSVS